MSRAVDAAPAAWLVKEEPETYSFDQFLAERRAGWEGVRNHQARNNLAAMKRGDLVLYYHTGRERAIVGLARVVREAYPDPTAADPRWVAVDLEAVRPVGRPLTLDAIKKDARLSAMPLVRQSRLSVMPVTRVELRHILELTATSLDV